jgi:hypothetical protein
MAVQRKRERKHVETENKGSDPQGPSEEMMTLRLFLASPGDVAHERQIAREVVDQVGGERGFRGRTHLELIAWDKPGVGIPIEAGLTPQEAIARGLPKPADCDLVVVLLWSRIGTPLPPEYTRTEGSPYLSGTEWEYENALAGFRDYGHPSIWLCRRTEEPKIGLRDPKRQEKEDQCRRVDKRSASTIRPQDQCRRVDKRSASTIRPQHQRPASTTVPEP